MGMFKVMVIGNLGNDPEMKTLPNGDALMNFSVGVTISVRNKGQSDKVTHWVRCAMFGKRAETLYKMLHKGKQVFVSGELNPRLWQPSDGDKKLSLDLKVDDVQLLGSKDDGHASEHSGGNGGGGYAPAGGGQQRQRSQQQQAPAQQEPTADDGGGGGGYGGDDDIPFARCDIGFDSTRDDAFDVARFRR